jgi:LacI family transcriptional regulator/LacI family purine nucleotide synthesis repressor
VVAVDIRHHGSAVRSVSSSNLFGGYAAVSYLMDKGHREIGFIGPIYAAQSIYERWCGYMQAMDAHNLNYQAPYNIMGNKNEFKLFDTVETLEPMVNAIKIFPTAWFCAGDRTAIALINILTRKGIKLPDEISIIGFDDIPMSQLVFPALTTMRVDRRLMGKLAFNMLIEPHYDARQNVTLTAQLTERDSVKKFSL